MVSESATTHLSLEISESKGTLCPNESTHQTWKHCRWWFLSRQLLSFRWCFPSQQGLCAQIIQASAGSQSRWWFLSRQRLSFRLRFRSQQRICALMNPRVIFGSIVVDGFWVGSYAAFDDDFRVNRTMCADESRHQLGRQSRWWFLSRSDSVFASDFRVNRDFVPWWIHALDLEALSLMVSVSAATELLVMISESTRTAGADESNLQLGRQSRWWFLSRQRLCFCLRFQSQQGLCAMMNPRDSCGSSLVDGFWVGSYTSFGDDFWVNRDCVRGQIQA
jgi:hypothetical protein